MITTIALAAFVAAACAWIGKRAISDHRAILAQRRRLLDEAATLFPDARITFAPDQFPILTSRLEDGRQVRVELLADTMVTRRLPQLWLRATLSELRESDRPAIGALARPTGAEYYSLVHDLPEWMAPPETDTSLLMRGDGRATAWQVERTATVFRSLFSDPGVKEAVIAPRGTRVIRQAAQGERAAHLFLRQIRFAVATIPADLVSKAVMEAKSLSEALAAGEPTIPVYEAA
ncbi:putative signal peptide protein [Mesorhizobium sp. ORS 3324]|nr:putative signal peptide protein [Mesorhizobium sp. ORS 3324]